MELEELYEMGYAERANIKTPAGGDYSDAHFFDDEWHYTEKEKARHVIIREYSTDGKLLKETFMNKTVQPNEKVNCEKLIEV